MVANLAAAARGQAGQHSWLDTALEQELEKIRAADLYRVRRVICGGHGVTVHVDGRECLNFCSNDYLGLAADPRPAAAAQRVAAAGGVGSGAAALISGYDHEHRALEEALAEFLGRPRVLLFTSGWAANLGVIRALLDRGDTLFADELNHASLIDGGRLSRAAYQRIPHCDVAAFAAALQATAGSTGRRLLVTDGVFSMDGDIADLPALQAATQQHDAALMVDDAHGFCVLGAHGRGSLELLDVAPDVHVATLGKALGAAGAFVSGSETLIEYLIQRARSWVFSTAPPPAIAAAAREALRIVVAEPERRQRLRDNIQRFRAAVTAQGIALGQPEAAGLRGAPTPIQPLVLGASARAMGVSKALFQQGFWVAAIRPPTVPADTARLRITLSAAHEPAQIDALAEALGRALAQYHRS
ncbi:MAG: 8-amino-7-oxononanoate synthase [Nevskiaceae bacterium]|nr:MAG: 8-amino-7-oxononanoate synthase [Nevskiaceae bacterium]TBR73149.1 MAG: 8-amino-7-oxononanoate synthase [Nevskiaceae bacterium]